MTTTTAIRWAWLPLGLAAARYAPHIWRATLVYEDAALLYSLTQAIPVGPRVLTRWLWRLHGGDPVLAHAASLALHLIVASLTGWLVSRMGYRSSAAVVAVAVVALHPLAVETVAYAAQQGELIAAIGVLGACVLAAGDWWRPRALLGIVAALGVGIAGKETAVVGLGLVPLVIAATDAARTDALARANGSDLRAWTAPARPSWARPLVPTLVAIGIALISIVALGGIRAIANTGESPGVNAHVGSWVLLQGAAAARTLALLVVPLGPWTVDYDYDAVPVAARGVFTGTLVLITTLVCWWRHRQAIPASLFIGWVWCLIVLAPRFLVQTPRSYLNDHQAYLLLPALGLVVAALWARQGEQEA